MTKPGNNEDKAVQPTVSAERNKKNARHEKLARALKQNLMRRKAADAAKHKENEDK